MITTMQTLDLCSSRRLKFRWANLVLHLWFQSILWDNDIKSTKHTLKEMIMHYSSLELPEGKAVIKSECLADLA